MMFNVHSLYQAARLWAAVRNLGGDPLHDLRNVGFAGSCRAFQALLEDFADDPHRALELSEACSGEDEVRIADLVLDEVTS